MNSGEEIIGRNWKEEEKKEYMNEATNWCLLFKELHHISLTFISFIIKKGKMYDESNRTTSHQVFHEEAKENNDH